jgi:hypothetical protein
LSRLLRCSLSEQRQNNKPVISSNFRMDVNASNNIDSADEDERRALSDPRAARQA